MTGQGNMATPPSPCVSTREPTFVETRPDLLYNVNVQAHTLWDPPPSIHAPPRPKEPPDRPGVESKGVPVQEPLPTYRVILAKPRAASVEEIPDEGDGPQYISNDLEGELLGNPPKETPAKKFAHHANQEGPRARTERAEYGGAPGAPTIRCVKARSMPPGKLSLGIMALSVVDGRLGSLKGPKIQLRLDSGADIMLISEECYQSLPSRLKLQKGMKLSLFELTNQAKILGYINVTVLMPTVEGKWLEFMEEAYVIPGMNVPILLGEDFLVNYEVSVLRTAQSSLLSIQQPQGAFRVNAQSTSLTSPNVKVKPNYPSGVRDREAYLAASREQGSRAKNEPRPLKDRLARAAEDRRIRPGHNANVKLQGSFGGLDYWFVE